MLYLQYFFNPDYSHFMCLVATWLVAATLEGTALELEQKFEGY